jgi:hypothetical protein
MKDRKGALLRMSGSGCDPGGDRCIGKVQLRHFPERSRSVDWGVLRMAAPGKVCRFGEVRSEERSGRDENEDCEVFRD